MGKFLSAARRKNNKAEEIKQVLARLLKDKSPAQPVPPLDLNFTNTLQKPWHNGE
jgi:hypothetical protein